MITSVRNRRVVAAARLKKRALRERDRAFLVEGAKGVAEALASGAVREVFVTSEPAERLERVLAAAATRSVPVMPVSPEVMAHLTSTVTPQGVVAVAGFVDVALDAVPADGRCVPVLVEVRDPGNAGAVLRSADAADAAAVVFTRSSVDVYNQKTVRASAGSLFHLPVVREVEPAEAVEALRARGFGVLAAAADGEASVYEAPLASPTAVLFGNEARGLPPEVRALADGSVRVPIAGRAGSLNLAATATLVLFEAARRRASSSRPDLAGVVAAAAHDIRSPLAALRGFAATLGRRWDRLRDEEREFMLAGLAHDAARLEVLLSLLVDAARIRAGRLELSPERVDLLAEARRVGEEAGGGGRPEVRVRGEPTFALVDRSRVRTMLAALVEAARWWGEEGPVEVEVGTADGPTVAVRRAGPPVELPSGPVSSGQGGGRVGLVVAGELAEAQGGSLRAEGSSGVAFTLRLPPAED